MRMLIWLGAVVLLTGCLPFVKGEPVYVRCKGKGSIAGQGHLSAGYGSGNMFDLKLDCGEELLFEQRKYAPKGTADKE